MERTYGTISRGIRGPIISEGDNIVDVVVNSVMQSSQNEGYQLNDMDVIGVTESVVARSQGNYVTVDDIADEFRQKCPSGNLSVVFPILSRNRFSILLKGMARGSKNIDLYLKFPTDEVGNALMDIDKLDELYLDETASFSETRYRELFGFETKHQFTGVDYVELYKSIITEEDCNATVHLTNDVTEAVRGNNSILIATICGKERLTRKVKRAGAEVVYTLDQICTTPQKNKGYNPEYGLLGSNMAGSERVKLFPRDSTKYAIEIQRKMKEFTGKHLEVLIYGDGAFKDPVGGIWELADPTVSPGHTTGLSGTPNELKLKYYADTHLVGETDREEAMKEHIRKKDENLTGDIRSQGTTPRRFTDLIGSLCDLTSGSGDKGTPIVLVQGYFDNYASK